MIVKALDNEKGYITKGRWYEVMHIGVEEYLITCNTGDNTFFDKELFEVVKEGGLEIIPCPFKVGKFYKNAWGTVFQFLKALPGQQSMFRACNDSYLYTTYADGRLFKYKGDRSDIRPTPINTCKTCNQELSNYQQALIHSFKKLSKSVGELTEHEWDEFFTKLREDVDRLEGER